MTQRLEVASATIECKLRALKPGDPSGFRLSVVKEKPSEFAEPQAG